jgi:hypothetical protein
MDGISGGKVVLYYRLPSTRERIAFQKGCYKEKNGKLVNQTVAARAAYGELILTGVRDGDFVFGDTPISSDPTSPNYRKEWKELVSATAGDLLITLGMHVFEGTIQNLMQTLADKPATEPPPAGDDEEEVGLPNIDDLEDGETIVPLAQS